MTLTFDLEITLWLNSHLLAKRYPWYLTIYDIWLNCDEIIGFSGCNNAHFRAKCWKFWYLTLTFDLEMTLSLSSHRLEKRYYWYLTTDEVWLKYDKIIRFSGCNNAHFSKKMVKNLKSDLHLWPWNDIEGGFSFAGKELPLIYVTRDEIWLKCDEIIRFSRWKCSF